MGRIEYHLASTVLRLVGLLCSVLPIARRRVVLATARTSTLDGNLAHLYAAMRAQRPDLDYVLLLEPYSYGFAGKLRYLGRLIRGMYHLRTASLFVVDNAYLPIHVGRHRRGTTVVQVWHAVAALKRFGADVLTPLAEPERRFLHHHYDYVVSSAQASKAIYAKAFRTPMEHVLPLGAPRTDFFVDDAAMAAARDRVLAAYPALAGRRVVLYAPTFRGRGVAKRAAPGLDAVALRAALPADTLLVLKTHPNLDPRATSTAGFDLVVDRIAEINELFTVADVLITDYSSSIFEWALLHRPLVLLVPDLAAYEADPGLYLDYRTEMIGAHVTDTAGVIDALLGERFDLAPYDAFIAHHMGDSVGRASDRFVERFLGRRPGSGRRSDTLPRDVRHE